MVVTNYSVKGPKNLRIALVADLHDNDDAELLSEIRAASPDLIAAAGDIMNENRDDLAIPEEQKHAVHFLREAAKIAPTFYSLGNNEKVVEDQEEWIHWNRIRETGVILLDNEYVSSDGLWIGGLTSAYSHIWSEQVPPTRRHSPKEHPRPNTDWLWEFEARPGYKILLCHHPEYYPAYLTHTSIDLILSGHAHGGQWRVLGQGLYAPGQGIFPKLTSGVHDGRLVISRGLANTARVPRIHNPKELVLVDVTAAG